MKFTEEILSVIIGAMNTKEIRHTVTGTSGGRLKGPPGSSDSSCLLRCAFSPFSTNRFLCAHHAGWGWGQVHSGGAFPGPVFPSSRWNFQKATDPRHWTPPVPRPPQPREPQRSRRGSRKLLDFPVAAAFARNRNPRPAPPTRPSGTRCGGWGLGMRAHPKWAAGPARQRRRGELQRGPDPRRPRPASGSAPPTPPTGKPRA